MDALVCAFCLALGVFAAAEHRRCCRLEWELAWEKRKLAAIVAAYQNLLDRTTVRVDPETNGERTAA